MSAASRRPLDPDGPKPWWNGPAGKGAMSKLREFKRLTAEDRNKLTLPENRSTKRQHHDAQEQAS